MLKLKMCIKEDRETWKGILVPADTSPVLHFRTFKAFISSDAGASDCRGLTAETSQALLSSEESCPHPKTVPLPGGCSHPMTS